MDEVNRRMIFRRKIGAKSWKLNTIPHQHMIQTKSGRKRIAANGPLPGRLII